MNPMFAFLKKQKPEWEEYLNMIELMNAEHSDIDEDDEDTLSETTTSKNTHKAYKNKIIKLKKTQNKLLHMIEDLKAELEDEQELTEDLAEALGACPECFGEDDMCTYCKGEGLPGFFVPDFTQYNRFVAPANKKFSKHYRIRN